MRRIVLFALILALAATTAMAGDYNYVKPEQFKEWLNSGREAVIVDIQVPEGFAKSHFKGAIETNAYPVKSDQEKARLEKTLALINATKAEVVIVCPRGGGGAKGAYDFLKGKGVDERRLLILEKGMEGWPYPELSLSGRQSS